MCEAFQDTNPYNAPMYKKRQQKQFDIVQLIMFDVRASSARQLQLQLATCSAMKLRSLGIVLRTLGHSHQTGESGLSLRVRKFRFAAARPKMLRIALVMRNKFGTFCRLYDSKFKETYILKKWHVFKKGKMKVG